jgi:hypothetical protein
MVRKVVLLTAAALFVASAAFASPQDKGKKKKLTEVTVCPMTGKEAKGDANTKVVGKYNVHFCCGNCPAAFDKLSKKEQAAKIKAAMKPVKKAETGETKLVVVNTCPMTGEDAKSAAGGTCKVGNYEVHFCCAGCKAPFEKMTVAEQEAKIKAALKKG